MPLTGDSQVNKKAFRIAINSQKLARFHPLDREKTANVLLRSGPHHFRHGGARAFGQALCSGLYITSAYWFTASTSFANPAGSRNNDRIAFDLAITIALEICVFLIISHLGLSID